MSQEFEATFDYICHSLPCPECGESAADPCTIDLQTKLARTKELRAFRVGDPFPLSEDPRTDGGYLRLAERRSVHRLRVIEAWSCPSCGAAFLWARLTIEGRILRSVEPVELTEAILESSDWITSEALMLFPMERSLEIKALGVSSLRAELLAAEKEHLEVSRSSRCAVGRPP